MTRDEMLQDLAYARALAEEGRHTPLLGGAYYVFWGALNALAFAGQWAILTGRAPGAEGAGFGVLWMSYGLIAAIGVPLLHMRTRTKPGLSSISSRAEYAVWCGASWALIAIVVGSLARMIVDQDVTAPNAIFGAAFAMYGIAIVAVARLAEQPWLRTFGWLSVLIACALCVFANQPWAYLIASAGSLAVLVVPGVILLRHEPSAIV